MDARSLRERLAAIDTVETYGKVIATHGVIVRATLPSARIGEVVQIIRGQSLPPLLAEVSAFDPSGVVLLPLGNTTGISADDIVERTQQPLQLLCGDGLIGHVLNGLGQSYGDITNDKQLGILTPWSVERAAPSVLERPLIREVLPTGIRAVDGLFPLGKGQRVAVFGPPGSGKTSLMTALLNQCECDVIVCALVGERGREVREYLQAFDQGNTRSKTVTVLATSDDPSIVRVRSVFVATAIAEYFRDQGKHVLLAIDSLTRWARAQREAGLSVGENPVRKGFPPSVFAQLPKLIERAGTSPKGTITALYNVLVEGNDWDDPVVDEVKSLVDGHIVLDTSLADQGKFPAISVLRSRSRLLPVLSTEEHRAWTHRFFTLWSAYEERKDLIVLGAYQKGSDTQTDRAIQKLDKMQDFLYGADAMKTTRNKTLQWLRAIVT